MGNLILDSRYFLAQNAQIWAFGIEVSETKASRKVQISTTVDHFSIFGVLSVGFCSFDWFPLVLAGFG